MIYMSILCGGFKEMHTYTPEEMKKLHTRQLLGELKHTYHCACAYCWKDSDWKQLDNYKAQLKQELATREHIPNKQESKAIRKAKIKKGV
jgi:hypothetical protein